jgi:hypothetical protein
VTICFFSRVTKAESESHPLDRRPGQAGKLLNQQFQLYYDKQWIPILWKPSSKTYMFVAFKKQAWNPASWVPAHLKVMVHLFDNLTTAT